MRWKEIIRKDLMTNVASKEGGANIEALNRLRWRKTVRSCVAQTALCCSDLFAVVAVQARECLVFSRIYLTLTILENYS